MRERVWAASAAAVVSVLSGAGAACGATASPGFDVRLDDALGDPAAEPGRLVVYLIRDGSGVPERAEPGDAPFYEDPQPLYGMDVGPATDWTGVRMTDGTATGFPGPMAELGPGSYRAQAVYDRNQRYGSWRREAGNLFSDVVRFTVDESGGWGDVALTLNRAVGEPAPPRMEGVEVVEIESGLLGDFRGHPVTMRAGVVPPLGHEPGEAYPALYVVPGFGGNHLMARRIAAGRRGLEPGTPEHTLASSVFVIVLDPDGPHGHTLFADSANNGPVGRALTEELIPALEARFNLIPRPEARLLNGHSSGGWTTVWLATEYPEVFGAAWSSAPDPVDFHAFQKINIYEDPGMYWRSGPDGGREPIPSYTEGGEVLMTVREEIGVENVIGPRNTSGQQWHSWMAVFGPRAADGRPAALHDPRTGDIDHAVANEFREYDITARLRTDPARYAPLFRERIRLLVGGADSYDLHLAVLRLRDTLAEVAPKITLEVTPGSITVVPGKDHSDVLDTDAARAWPADMVTHLRRAGLRVGGAG
jgi:hypothetical protein